MTDLKCDAVNCGYNCGGLCSRDNICVSGNDAYSCSGTCCGNFSDSFSQEYDSEPKSGTEIECSAGNCGYNENGCCCRGDIEIGGRSARSCSDTSCESFRME